ncbi:hypothetical protein T310_8805, partial [Rasamsonia emersonii CBS 393.64]
VLTDCPLPAATHPTRLDHAQAPSSPQAHQLPAALSLGRSKQPSRLPAPPPLICCCAAAALLSLLPLPWPCGGPFRRLQVQPAASHTALPPLAIVTDPNHNPSLAAKLRLLPVLCLRNLSSPVRCPLHRCLAS